MRPKRKTGYKILKWNWTGGPSSCPEGEQFSLPIKNQSLKRIFERWGHQIDKPNSKQAIFLRGAQTPCPYGTHRYHLTFWYELYPGDTLKDRTIGVFGIEE